MNAQPSLGEAQFPKSTTSAVARAHTSRTNGNGSGGTLDSHQTPARRVAKRCRYRPTDGPRAA